MKRAVRVEFGRILAGLKAGKTVRIRVRSETFVFEPTDQTIEQVQAMLDGRDREYTAQLLERLKRAGAGVGEGRADAR